MTACRAGHMTLKPGINTILMKSMNTVTQNAHGLPLFHPILTNGAIFVVGIHGSQNGGGRNLFMGRSNNNRLHYVARTKERREKLFRVRGATRGSAALPCGKKQFVGINIIHHVGNERNCQ
jgi:hypothetical protein